MKMRFYLPGVDVYLNLKEMLFTVAIIAGLFGLYFGTYFLLRGIL